MQPDPKLGVGGAPTRATTLPNDPQARKEHPVASGFMDYFPDAIAAISHISFRGNQQHNPGQPLFWNRSKSSDEADTMMRHFLQRGTLDVDGVRHSAKMAWRALALLQKEIEDEMKKPTPEVEVGSKVDVTESELWLMQKKGWTIHDIIRARQQEVNRKCDAFTAAMQPGGYPVQVEQPQLDEPLRVANGSEHTALELSGRRPSSYSR